MGGLLLFGLVACGGDDSTSGGSSSGGTAIDGDTDAQEVLDGALGSGGDSVDSGVLDLAFDLKPSQADSGTGAINAEISGPFSSNGEGKLPSVNFAVKASADTGGPTLSFDGGLTLTGDGLFVNYDDEDYKLDDQAFGMLQSNYSDSAQLQQDQGDGGGSLSSFGVDPATWLADVTNEGVEDVDGAEAVHVSGSGDIEKIVADLGKIASQSGQGQVDTASLKQLQDSVTNATVDVYANTGDGTLRKLDLTVDVADASGGGSSTVAISIGIADANSEQDISGPSDAKPLEELIAQLGGGISSLGGLQGATDTAPPAGDPAPPAADPVPPADPGAPPAQGGQGSGSDQYFQCVQQAPTPKDIEDCAKLFQG